MDLFTEFMKLVTSLSVRIGWLIGAGLQNLYLSAFRVSTRLPAPTKSQKHEEDESRRLAGCREVVLDVINHLGFIARECMSREELEEKIDRGITPEALAQELDKRIRALPGILLGTYGRNGYEIKQPFSVRDRHTYIVGKSGSGKTNLLRNMILQDLDFGNGVGILAPELELLTEEILPYIPEDRIDDVVFVNPVDTDCPIPFNPLHVDTDEDIDLKVDDAVTIFKRLMGETGARMDEILRQSFYALMERPRSTLVDIERLLSRQDTTLRNEIIQRSRDEQTVRFFRDTYPSFPKDAHLPITNRISRLVRPKTVRSLLCQPGRSFNFREAMDEGKILLFNLSDGLLGEQTSQLLGQLIVSKMQMAVMSRMDTPAAYRRPFYLYLDEFQTFTGVAETSYANILSRARKYKLGLILAHQQTGQLSPDLMRDILGNVSTLLTFNVSHDDAVKLSREYVKGQGAAMEYMPPGELLSLKTGEAWGKIGKSCFFLSTALAPQQPDFQRAMEVIQRSRKNYGAGGVWEAEVKRPPKNPPKQLPEKGTEEPPDPSEVF